MKIGVKKIVPAEIRLSLNELVLCMVGIWFMVGTCEKIKSIAFAGITL